MSHHLSDPTPKLTKQFRYQHLDAVDVRHTLEDHQTTSGKAQAMS